MKLSRLATYNIHKFVGTDRKWDPERVIGVVRALDADIVAIQEFTVAHGRSAAPGPRDFATHCGFHHVVEQKMHLRSGRPQYNLLLSKVPLRRAKLVPLLVRGGEERGAIVTETEDGALRIVATHLAVARRRRSRQFEMLIEAATHDDGMPLALIGDFNAYLPFETVRRRLSLDFPGILSPRTFPSRRPVLPLDRIAVRPEGILRTLTAFNAHGARVASDHLPLVGDIVLPASATKMPGKAEASAASP